MKAVVVDSEYGSVKTEFLQYLQEEYKKKGISLDIKHFIDEDEIIANCKEYDIILATGNPPLTNKVFENLNNLKLVQRFGIGVNSIDLDAATENGTVVMNMPGFCDQELAVHATSMILGILRNLRLYDTGIREDKWLKANGIIPSNPSDLTIGLFGFGQSAKKLYKIFKNGFNSNIVVHDPYIKKEDIKDYEVTLLDFDQLLKESDVVSIHVPLTEETKYKFNKETFNKMKNSAIIINISRGGIIQEDDLIDALEKGDIRAAGLDVFENEPNINKRWKRVENSILTPHSAFFGEKARDKQISLAKKLVIDFSENRINEKYIANKKIIERIKKWM